MNQCMRIFVILGTVSYLTGCGTLDNFMGTQDNAPAAMTAPVSNIQPTNQPATNMTGQESLNPNTPADTTAPTAATKAQTNPSAPSSNVIPVVSQPPQNQPSTPSTASSTGNDNNASEVRSTPDTE